MRTAIVLIVLSLAGCASRPASEPAHRGPCASPAPASVGTLYRQPEGLYRESDPADVRGTPHGFAVVVEPHDLPPGNERHGYGATPDEAAHNAGATAWQTADPIEVVAEEECPGGVCHVPGATALQSPPAAPPAAPRPEVDPAPPPPAPSPREPAQWLGALAATLGALVVVLAAAVVYTVRALRRGSS